MQIHKLMVLLCCPALSHFQREESTLIGVGAPVPGRCPNGLTVNTLVHGKGLTYLDAFPSHFLHSEFFQRKGDGEKTTGRAASLPAVRKVMVKLTWALLGDTPEPTEATSLVLPLNLSAVGLVSDLHSFWSKIIQKAWPSLPSPGKAKPNQEHAYLKL